MFNIVLPAIFITQLAHSCFPFSFVVEALSATMDFRPREAPFFGDYFFRFGPIAFKFSHTSFQTKRRLLSIWSVNKKSIIRVLVIAS